MDWFGPILSLVSLVSLSFYLIYMTGMHRRKMPRLSNDSSDNLFLEMGHSLGDVLNH